MADGLLDAALRAATIRGLFATAYGGEEQS